MNTMAVLQNQWFKDPEKIRAIYERHCKTPEDRADLHARFLFRSSLTGRRLQQAFGESACNRIIWEEASPNVGAESSAAFPACPQHIANLITHFRPAVVLAFGRIARGGVDVALRLLPAPHNVTLITGPHPAARHATVTDELRAMAAEWRRRLAVPAAEPSGV